jgi:hypothetical protein
MGDDIEDGIMWMIISQWVTIVLLALILWRVW